MLDPLVHRQNREVTGPPQPTVIEDHLEVPQHRRRPVRRREHLVDERRPGKMKHLLRHRPALVAKQTLRVRTQNSDDLIAHVSLLPKRNIIVIRVTRLVDFRHTIRTGPRDAKKQIGSIRAGSSA